LKDKKLFWKFYQPYLIIILFVLAIFGILLSKSFKDFYLNQTEESLIQTAQIIKSDINNDIKIDTAELNSRFKNYESVLKIRVTLIDTSGKVIADSKANAESMDIHKDRTEFIEALKGNTGFSIRKSYTLGTELMYIAIPVYDKSNNISKIIRTASSIEELNYEFRVINLKIILLSAILYLIVSIIFYFISRKIVRPVEEMKKGAIQLASGNLNQKIYSPNIEEFSSLANSLNTMSFQLNEKLKIIEEQKNTLESVLESMKEGVIAVDNAMNILFINREASRLLKIEDKNIIGKSIQETVRIFDFQKLIQQIQKNGQKIETELNIKEEKKDIVLQLIGNVLRNNENKSIGIIVVINDVSERNYLDTLKSDFVANVSHELKTPITTIKGFAETLRDCAIEDRENIKRFIEIIFKNSVRLNAIIDDLLNLSRLEKTSNIENIEKNHVKILPLIKSSIEGLNVRVEQKGINIKYECEKNVEALINSNLIEQALTNLIDNAIKYSLENTEINVIARTDFNNLIIIVKDQGYGIPEEHIERLFERFYRIDKGRSRENGGTGLGLAIVKHIIKIHKGTIQVQSNINSGSEFKIIIPLN
jgi:two-component system, OmpR family, phosphate regulon sensor histidine kinase PhoR